MNIEKMKKIVKLQNELKEEGVFGFHIEGAFQVDSESLKHEPNLKLVSRGTTEYPYEIYSQHDGIKIYAVLRTDELKKFPQFKQQAKDELLKKLAYLEEDVDLSGMKEGEQYVS